MKMKQKMLGLFLVSLFAMSMIGVTYAYWFEYLYIEGEVTMGTFWGELTLFDWGDNDDGIVFLGMTKDVGSVYAELLDYEDELLPDGGTYPAAKQLTITIDEAYPGYCAWVWWDMHWGGTVPAHVSVTGPQDVPDWVEIIVEVTYSDLMNDDFAGDDIPEGVYTLDEFLAYVETSQWHECQYIEVKFWFCIIEIDRQIGPCEWVTIMGPDPGAQYSFDLVFYFEQYNIHDPPAGWPNGG